MKLKINTFVKSALLLFLMTALGTSAFAQRTVSGTITDADGGDPLIGATVMAVGTSTGTITDFDGKYSLEVPDGTTELEFSYTGYGTQRAALGAGNVLDFAMSAGTLLDEVVVVGYGTVKRSDLTGSVSSVKAEDFNGGINVSPDQLIQGKVAGVQILNNSGAPGGAATVRIRGNSSVRTGNQPLYVVDGVPLDGRSARPGLGAADLGDTPGNNPLNFINPNDIASMEVLKDASATAIYGSRGANGVIIITTKKGRRGSPTLDFGVSTGFSNVLKKYDVLDGDEYRAALTKYGLTGGDFGENVDAQDEILQTGITQNYNFAIGGGSEDGSYRISASYLDQEGIIVGSGLKKYTAGLNGSYKFLDSKRLSVDFNILSSFEKTNGAAISNNAGFTGSLMGQALQWNPTKPLRNDDGTLNIELGSTTINPVAMLESYTDISDVTTFLASVAPSFKLTDNLNYKFLYSINHGVGQRRAEIASWINVQGVEGRGWAGILNSTLTTQQFTHTLNFDQALSSSVNLNAVVGYEYQKFLKKENGVVAQDFLSDDVNFTDILYNSSQGSRSLFGFNDPTTELQSYFGRAIVNISEKYLITATVRADGSSKFGDNNKYGVFPSVGLAWNISNEDFAPDAFDNLKLRLSWGQTGNQEFPAGSSQERYGFGADGTFAGLVNVANPDLKWETSTTANVGVDFALFDYRLTGSIDYFNKVTSDLLFQFPTIQPAPATFYWINLEGEVVNSGLEVALNSTLVSNDNLTWDLGVNASFLKNELRDYVGPDVLTGALHGQGITGTTVQRLDNGQPLNAFYTREYLGLNTQVNDGSFVSEYTLNEAGGEANVYLGDPNPDLLLGISTSLSLGDLSLGLNFNGAYGHLVYNNTFNAVIPIGNLGSRNIDATLIEGDKLESLSNPIKSSSRYLEDGGYLKLANASLGYNIGSIGNVVKTARVYVTGQNLLVFTNYSGFDPEVNTDKQVNGVPSFGIEYTPYPSARSFIVGLNFSF